MKIEVDIEECAALVRRGSEHVVSVLKTEITHALKVYINRVAEQMSQQLVAMAVAHPERGIIKVTVELPDLKP